jgi:hypothetical protein
MHTGYFVRLGAYPLNCVVARCGWVDREHAHWGTSPDQAKPSGGAVKVLPPGERTAFDPLPNLARRSLPNPIYSAGW